LLNVRNKSRKKTTNILLENDKVQHFNGKINDFIDFLAFRRKVCNKSEGFTIPGLKV